MLVNSPGYARGKASFLYLPDLLGQLCIISVVFVVAVPFVVTKACFERWFRDSYIDFARIFCLRRRKSSFVHQVASQALTIQRAALAFMAVAVSSLHWAVVF